MRGARRMALRERGNLQYRLGDAGRRGALARKITYGPLAEQAALR
jgi:hypothetical protein